MKVSWQVTGIRKDPWANANRIKVEKEKPSKERNYYLHPGLYGKSPKRSIQWVRYGKDMQKQKEIDDTMKKLKQRVSIKRPLLTRWKTRTGKGHKLIPASHGRKIS
jgi:hypothetical protein